MTSYFIVKYVHVIGAAVLLGTGAGIAFFMLLAHISRDAATIAAVARMVVVADFLFTTTAVILQPITGFLLVWLVGWRWTESWIVLSLALYVFTGLFWLPVVWMQMRMRDLAAGAVKRGEALPPAYHRLFAWWFAFGFPAFFAVIAIYWLMVVKPVLW